MTIWEYVKEPHPWFDTTNYTPLQIALFFTGAMLWIVAYIEIIRMAWKHKTVIIPAVAVVCNWGNEIGGAFFWVPDMGKALVLAYWGWFLLDIFIVYKTFQYGYKQFTTDFFKNNLRLLLVMGLMASIPLSSFFMVQYDLPMGVIDAYIVNVVMSVSFLSLLFVPNFPEHSVVLAWAKFLGTGCISIMFQSKYPENHFLTVAYFTVAAFDILFIILMYKKRKRMALV
ncbi:MAG: hypothetical protein KA954_10310 [Chitinophagales bacterium]|nr:hypothetical protein [Bacteroidota bacterium]MBP7399968.1 hypothetical protein [Chitinophagales bacterium]MBK8683174.1 hypothetical protein [Bacteroidota bacterium]MBP8754781.1 hypothetical protein [Chitinophagales bacterium]MBP9190498.1 hypothetical protein [Chitinophagales bacterium]